jgi:hypothetical protein
MRMLTQKLFILSVLIALCGCISSKDALFDPPAATLPLVKGHYEAQVYSGGQWTALEKGSLETGGRSYFWTKDGNTIPTEYSLYTASINSFIIAEKTYDGTYRYGLLRQSPDGWLLYAPTCDEIFKLKKFDEFQISKIDKHSCLYTTTRPLIQDLIRFADGAGKWLRLVASK